MLCPTCGKEMELYQEGTSHGKSTNTEYKRLYYRCTKDDTWGRLEVPQGPLSELDKQRLQTQATG